MIERKRGRIIQSERNTEKTNTTFYTLRREVFMKKNQLENNFSNNEIGVSETRKKSRSESTRSSDTLNTHIGS